MARLVNDVQLPAAQREPIPVQDDTDESPEDFVEDLLVVCGVSGLLILGLVVGIPLLAVLL